MNTCVYNSCIIRAYPASSIRVGDNCAQVASDSANYERPMCRSKHELRGRCWEQNMNWGHLHRYEKCWKSKMCFLFEWGAWFQKCQIRKKAHLMKWWVSAVRAQDDNCAQVTSESANYERPVWRSKHELRALASTWKVLKIENVLPAAVGSMILKMPFSNQVTVRIVFFAFGSARAERNENHENQLDGGFGSAGRNARGRWEEIWGGSEI